MMRGNTCLLGIAIAFMLIAWSSYVCAQVDYNDYYQFRHSSTLPGMMFGVTPAGEVGFAGAFQQNIPVAYTPVTGNFVAGGNAGSNNNQFQFSTRDRDINGTAFIGAGLGQSGHGGYVSWMSTGSDWAEAWNAQLQLTRGDGRQPAFAVGVQDLFNERERFSPQDHHNARSVYFTATAPLSEATDSPIYWSAGWGTGRFDRAFAGVSLALNPHMRLVTEYDGFGANAGLALGLNGTRTRQKYDAIAYLGYTGLARPVVGAVLTWR